MSGKKKLNAATFVITSVVEKEKLRGEKNNGPTRLNVSRPLPLAEKNRYTILFRFFRGNWRLWTDVQWNLHFPNVIITQYSIISTRKNTNRRLCGDKIWFEIDVEHAHVQTKLEILGKLKNNRISTKLIKVHNGKSTITGVRKKESLARCACILKFMNAAKKWKCRRCCVPIVHAC